MCCNDQVIVRVVFISAILAHGLASRADIVIDEFEEIDEVRLPQMNLEYVRQDGVGALAALRSLRFVAFDTDPNGQFKVEPDGTGALTAEINELTPRWSGDRTVHLQFWYDFPFVDATGGGDYNAFLLDFLSLEKGNAASVQLRTFVGDNVSSRYNRTITVPSDGAPFTVAVPFSLFREGSNPIDPDFTQLQSVHFGIGVQAPPDQNALDFAMRLDRVRIARAIPEPHGFVASYISVCCFTFCAGYARRISASAKVAARAI
jgi:hypothetical protein